MTDDHSFPVRGMDKVREPTAMELEQARVALAKARRKIRKAEEEAAVKAELDAHIRGKNLFPPAESKPRWRTGRKLGRTLYLQQGSEPSDSDIFLGLMESAELAQRIVDLINNQESA